MRNFIFCAALCALAAGCGKEGPDRVSVHGNVNVDGAPLDKGSIVFVPVDGTLGPKAAGAIENGVYQLAKTDGPVVGKVRVEIRADYNLGFELDDAEQVVKNALPNEVIPPNTIPPNYNDQSTLVRETTPGADNTFDFEIDTKTETESE